MKFETETTIPVADPIKVMSVFVTHLEEEHDLQSEAAQDGSKFFEQNGFSIKFSPGSHGLNVRITGPSESIFVFFKEEIAEHVREMDPAAAAKIRWSGESAREGALPPNFKVLTIKGSYEVFRGLQRVTLVHDDVESFATNDLHVKLMLPLTPKQPPVWPKMAANGAPVWPDGEDKLHARFVTLRHVRPDDGEIDVDIAHHNNGLISNWALQAEPEQTVGVLGPAGVITLRQTKNLFLAADSTGIATVARLLEVLPDDASGNVVVAAPGGYDIREYFPATRLHLHSVDPDRFEREIVEKTRGLTSAGQTTYAFFAGEFQNAQDLRKLFKTRLKLDKSTQISTAYWRRGTPGYS
ncbi:MAG: siderophore-interacting protein [Pseudomonadota bacterium]